MTRRLLAAAGTLLVAAALVVIVTARLSVPRDVYVSELGADGMPTARAFQTGLVLLVLGAVLIAAAARDIRSRVRVLGAWAPWATLAASSAFFLLASQVPCTVGCPVPVGDGFTWRDLVHTTAATLAFAAAAWAMLQCAFAVGHPLLARFSLVAAVSVAVVAAAGGLMSLLDWYSWFGSRLEFVATLIGIAWIGTLGVSIAARRSEAASSGAAHRLEQEVRQDDEPVDLVLVAVDPAALRLAGDRDEVDMALPDDERPLRA